MPRVALGLATTLVMTAGFAWSLAASRASTAPFPSPCLAATIVHAVHEEGDDGVVTDSRRVESFYRCDGRVWIERVLPERAPRTGTSPHTSREGPPLSRFARFVERRDAGESHASLVSRRDRLVVRLDDAARERNGVDRSFDALAEIVPKATLSSMAPAGLDPAGRDGTWFERRDGGETVRAFHSQALGLALEVVRTSDDGRHVERTTVEDVELPPRSDAPWDGLGGYAIRDASDYGD
ncbi:MAG: hypothetical protein U0169_13060 [Polyangiaceae bacterium]